MSEHTTTTTSKDAETSRRALLRGAVAAGVVGAAYTAPIIARVPSYAAHGLTTNHVQSGLICYGFSPNHQSNIGDWHLPAAVANVFDPAFSGTDFSNHANAPSTANIRARVRVPAGAGGTWREIQVSGHFNNWDGTTSGQYNVDGWNGGGIRITVVDSNCDILIQNWLRTTTTDATDCEATSSPAGLSMKPSDSPINGTDPGTSFTTGGYSFSGTKYFHSGEPRKNGQWVGGMRFRVRCWDNV